MKMADTITSDVIMTWDELICLIERAAGITGMSSTSIDLIQEMLDQLDLGVGFAVFQPFPENAPEERNNPEALLSFFNSAIFGDI